MCRTVVLLPLVPAEDFARHELQSYAANEAFRRAERLYREPSCALGVAQALKGIFPRLSSDLWAQWYGLFKRTCALQV